MADPVDKGQQVIDDLVALVIRLTGKLPNDRKALVILNRLQPNSTWQHMLDAKEHDRLQGIAAKMSINRASADEIAEHKEKAAAAAQTVADHTAATRGAS